MIGRVTQQTMQRSTLANLQLNLAKMSSLQEQMSSGKRITKPSDDPGGISTAMSMRSEKSAYTQYSRNIDDGLGWLSSADTALQSAVSQLRGARDLTVQSGSGALNASGREALATEIESVRDGLLAIANTQHQGRNVFAGTSDSAVAFDASYAWTGTAGGSVDRRVSPDTTVRADVDGSAAFGTGSSSVFALLDSIAADIRTGVDPGPRLAEIDVRMDTMLGELSGVGSRTNRMTTTQGVIENRLLDLQISISDIEDVDLTAAIVELQSQEVAYQGALGATARVLQPTLLDYLQ
ncbi:flagellar hook-associated protein FlgL [Actinotalea sp.]|uniref:flagellar hook-associated protein FlgL n=1 Tax=Actinotalea sp. TaxID=1872145 RepID=UPI0035685BFF